jgi:hypothetical protein
MNDFKFHRKDAESAVRLRRISFAFESPAEAGCKQRQMKNNQPTTENIQVN